MTSDFLTPQQEEFKSWQSNAWGSIREDHVAIEEAASKIWSAPDEDTEPQTLIDTLRLQSLSPFERLPDETLVTIMTYLDHGSLYCLSQVTGRFLRLSFDEIFEADAEWRAFRHTIDALRGGLGKRILVQPKGQDIKERTGGNGGESSTAAVQNSRLAQNEISAWNWNTVYKYDRGESGPRQQDFSESTKGKKEEKSPTEGGETMQEFMSSRSSWETASEDQ
ncbi:hypothetical protein F5Y16DRAFT_401960 [Xylariaceae sp. FL0255]|nr:hypothetical protein F5Y16DRAFT_401960 [Xylariaceae sp. FL0255]